LRIIAGEFGGRRLLVPKGRDIRPTSDKIRGAVFNALRSRGVVEGAHVLDCFCGTGALGLEALSQGAQSCLFIDKNRSSLDLARENAAGLKADQRSSFLLKDSTKLAKRPSAIQAADLVFLDPPYDKNMVAPTLQALQTGGWLAPDSMLVIETEKSSQLQDILENTESFECLDERLYGETKIFYMAETVSQ